MSILLTSESVSRSADMHLDYAVLCTAICMMIQQMHSENSACRQPIRGRRLDVCHSGALDTLDPLLLRGFFYFYFYFILFSFFLFISFSGHTLKYEVWTIKNGG